MKFTLRIKIILIFAIFLLAGGTAWYMNFNAYRQLTQSLQSLEEKDKFLNRILETRRYEKNYFLSGSKDNLSEALNFVRQARQQLAAMAEMPFKGGDAPEYFPRLLASLNTYQKTLAELLENSIPAFATGTRAGLVHDIQEHLVDVRKQGSFLTTEAEKMVKDQQRRVGRLLAQKKNFHFIALAQIIGLCFFTVLFLIFSVNRPLKAIEKGIAKIVRGDYENLPAMSKRDEFADLVTSLNHMLEEINRRTEQLIQSKKMASLGTLTSGVAHELNNPINNISTTIQILLEEIDEGDIEFKRMQLEEAERQVERARDIVRALLEFSRQTDYSIQQVYLHELIEDTLKLIRGEVPANVEIKVELPSDLKMALDPRMIQQVLINLIVNGIHAMPDGGPLYIRGFEKLDDQKVCIQVQDTGTGISAEDLPKIFDPFFSTKEVGHGTGLGLSVTHGIVRKHGGRIEVESEPARGTIFTVILPERLTSDSKVDGSSDGSTAVHDIDPSVE